MLRARPGSTTSAWTSSSACPASRWRRPSTTQRRTVALGPEHVSSYVLTVEREHLGAETLFSRRLRQGRLALPDDGVVVEMMDAVGEVLAGGGLARYENLQPRAPRPALAPQRAVLDRRRIAGGRRRRGGLPPRGHGRGPDDQPPQHPALARGRGGGPVAGRGARDARRGRASTRSASCWACGLRSGLDLPALWARQGVTPRRAELEALIRDGFVEPVEQRFRLTAAARTSTRSSAPGWSRSGRPQSRCASEVPSGGRQSARSGRPQHGSQCGRSRAPPVGADGGACG